MTEIKWFTVLAITASLFAFGCSRVNPANNTFYCGTPVGNVLISKETDTKIHFDHIGDELVLRATRGGKTITIPFVQCVAIND